MAPSRWPGLKLPRVDEGRAQGSWRTQSPPTEAQRTEGIHRGLEQRKTGTKLEKRAGRRGRNGRSRAPRIRTRGDRSALTVNWGAWHGTDRPASLPRCERFTIRRRSRRRRPPILPTSPFPVVSPPSALGPLSLSIVNRASAAHPDLRTTNPPPLRRTPRGRLAGQPPKPAPARSHGTILSQPYHEQADNRSSPRPALQQTFLGPLIRHERDGRHDEPGLGIGSRCRREDQSRASRRASESLRSSNPASAQLHVSSLVSNQYTSSHTSRRATAIALP